MSAQRDRWGNIAWLYQRSKADAVYDLLGVTFAEASGNLDLPGTLDVTGAVTLDSTLSVAGVPTFAAEPIVAIDSAVTNAVVDALTLRATSTGTPTAGLGPGVVFESENSTPAVHEQARIEVDWAVNTADSEDSDMRFYCYDGGAKTLMASLIGATPEVVIPVNLDVDAVIDLKGDGTNVIVLDTAATNFFKITATGQGGVTLDATLNTAPANTFLGYVKVDMNGTPGYVPIYTAPPTTT